MSPDLTFEETLEKLRGGMDSMAWLVNDTGHHDAALTKAAWEDREIAIAAIDAALAEHKRVREALEFYADPETYLAIGFFPDPPCGEFMDDFGETGTKDYGPRPGERARKALGYGS